MDPNEPAALALSRIVTLLEYPGVRNFIFPTTSQPDLLHLAITTSNSSPHPSTGVMNIATLPTASPDHALDETMRVLFVPCFTMGDITVGFQVFERVRTNTVNTTRFYLSRTVRDDVNGMFLSVSEHSLGTYELSYGTQMSACGREHALMLFQCGPFLRAAKSVPVNTELLRQALLYSFYSVEQNSCPICPPGGVCTCSIATRRKRHSMDYDMENQNMLTYCGEFDGLASVGTFWNGCKVFGDEVYSRVVSCIVRDEGLGQRLAQWGMREISKARGINIGRLEVHPVIRASFFSRGGGNISFGTDSLVGGDDGLLGWILNGEGGFHDSAFLPLSHDCEDSGDPVLESIESRKAGVLIAPAGVVVSSDRPENMDERSWKKELKRRRNRAAAHRSNERKKRGLEMMKRELAEFRGKVRLLREREESLRRENKGLRRAIMGDDEGG